MEPTPDRQVIGRYSRPRRLPKEDYGPDGSVLGKDRNMWREITLTWTIAASLLAALFVGSYVATTAAEANGGDQLLSASPRHFHPRQTSTVYQDPTGKYNIHLRSLQMGGPM